MLLHYLIIQMNHIQGDPDLSGDFVQHNTVSGTLFSPGTKTDGTPF